MNTQDLAKAFTDMCAKGELDAAGRKFWSDDIVSREPMSGDMAELKGRQAVERKSQWWNANHEVHDLKVEGPRRPVRRSLHVRCDAQGPETHAPR
jgi:hypothetical protein